MNTLASYFPKILDAGLSVSSHTVRLLHDAIEVKIESGCRELKEE